MRRPVCRDIRSLSRDKYTFKLPNARTTTNTGQVSCYRSGLAYPNVTIVPLLWLMSVGYGGGVGGERTRLKNIGKTALWVANGHLISWNGKSIHFRLKVTQNKRFIAIYRDVKHQIKQNSALPEIQKALAGKSEHVV